MDEEILNIDHHRRLLVLRALNRGGSVAGAARLTGYSERQICRLILRFDIVRREREFVFEGSCSSCRVADSFSPKAKNLGIFCAIR
jgi:Winged helix-turn helix